MDVLDFISPAIFQALGTLVGLAACLVIALQVVKEWRDERPSTLAITYVLGWALIFVFWLLYGIRFRAFAMWFTNIIAASLQTVLLVVVLRKRRR
jgi:uncharacterized protein with PQ loop repeat